MIPHRVTVEEATIYHATVGPDEAFFDDRYSPMSDDLAQATGAVEIEAYKAFAAIPCLFLADEQDAEEWRLHVEATIDGEVVRKAVIAVSGKVS